MTCLRPLLAFLLLALCLGMLAKFLGFWAWRRGWGPAGKDWHRHWARGAPPCGPHAHPAHGPRGPHGPMPPWCWGEQERADQGAGDEEAGDQEEQVGKVKPE